MDFKYSPNESRNLNSNINSNNSNNSDVQIVERPVRKRDTQSRLVKCIKDWCEETTMHGFRNISQTKYWPVKLGWVILVSISLFYCIYSKSKF
jgi:hypothetical protein